jgi:glycogen debranching enzyme
MTIKSELHQQARAILEMNDRGNYTIPTKGLYPYQWNWDSAFAALGFAQFDIDRAWTELETLFSAQWADGMVPHIVFHKADPGYFPGPEIWAGTGPIPSSGITQPPIAATMARLIFEKDPNSGADRIKALFPKMRAWHKWFMKWRLDQGAVCVTHPWEAGRDNTPEWDGPMARIDPADVGEYERRDTKHVDGSMRPTKFDYDRYIWLVQMGRRLNWDQQQLLAQNPFRVADPTMSFTLLRAQRDLLALGEMLEFDVDGLKEEIELLEKGVVTLWNPQLESFDARDAKTGEWSNCVSNASFLCWYAGVESAGQTKQLERVLNKVTYGVPSHDPESDKFDGKRYWRGPTWAVMNLLIGLGLEEMKHPLAQDVREMTRALIENHGFAEYFDPHDGSPAGGQAFTWTAAVWLSWAGQTQGGTNGIN